MKLTKPVKIKRLAMMTDIHWGKRNNSRIHNQDCLDFIDWFCALVKKDKGITHVAFLGDWFESRSSINIETLEFSYQGLKKLNSLGLPIYFVVGNHDLHKRLNRDIHSVNLFNELDNFTVIDAPVVIDGALFSPYLFEHEYTDLAQYNNCWFWAGHFEFKNFMITAYNTVMDHGPDHTLFKGPNFIFSGHFHKRQAADNVIYIGNAFPMDYGDAGDEERGACIYDVASNDVVFHNWLDCPRYHKTSLSTIITGKWNPAAKTKVKCLVDLDINYGEAQEIKQAMMVTHNLREFMLEENKLAKQELLEGDDEKLDEDELDFSSVDELVIKQLESITDTTTNINNLMLVEIYKSLKVDD